MINLTTRSIISLNVCRRIHVVPRTISYTITGGAKRELTRDRPMLFSCLKIRYRNTKTDIITWESNIRYTETMLPILPFILLTIYARVSGTGFALASSSDLPVYSS